MSAVERTYNVTEFKAKCLDIVDQLSRGALARVTVTKRGIPVVVVQPSEPQANWIEELQARMAGSVIIPDGFDLTEPILDEPFDAEQGILHR